MVKRLISSLLLGLLIGSPFCWGQGIGDRTRFADDWPAPRLDYIANDCVLIPWIALGQALNFRRRLGALHTDSFPGRECVPPMHMPSVIQVSFDWKATYRVNAILDGISTYQFRQHGAIELNPIAAPFVNNDRWLEAGILLLGEMAIVDWIESRLKGKYKGLAYIVGAVAHGICTWSNRKHGASVFPIPVLKVRF